MSGLRVGQLAGGQADKKICSVPKTRASKDATSPLGHDCLATEVHLLAGRARGSENWYRSLGQVPVSMILGDDVTDEERGLCRTWTVSSSLPPVPLSCLPVFHQSEVLVEMVLFLPSTFGFIPGFTGFLCFNLPLLKFLATLPKTHLFPQTKKMLAYQTNNDSP